MPTQIETVKLMQLEARRDFLRRHVDVIANKTGEQYIDQAPKAANASYQARVKAYEDEIMALKQFLNTVRQTHQMERSYIDVVVAEKIGDDNEGISTTMSKRFGQLTGDAQRNPFVLLDNSGVRFVWKNKQDAELFQAMLIQHGLTPTIQQDGLTATEVPEAMKKLEEKDRYQAKECFTVRIPHRQVEHLVALAQYHPYNCEATVREWYEARKIDRPMLLGHEIRKQPKQANLDSPIYTSEVVRVPFSDKEDLIRLTVAAQDTQLSKETKPHHVVILLDDSASMDNGPGSKMDAANQALRDFISKLPDDTLVSIQPFNAQTLAYRIPVTQMRNALDQYCSTHSSGGTPLVEILACSAVFAREKPDNYIISANELNHTTIALLTDGQGNGSSKDALAAMQETKNQSLQPCVKVPGVNSDNFMSYGLPNFRCQQLPVVLPISIGSDSDQTFMDGLADAFHVPGAFVHTDANMQRDINAAMDLLMQMRGRVGRAFLGLSYADQGKEEAVGREEQNLFFGRTREIYVTVPKGAKNFQSFSMIDGDCERQDLHALNQVTTDHSIVTSVCDAYVKQQLMELKLQFAKESNDITSGLQVGSYEGGNNFGRRGMPVRGVGRMPMRGGYVDEEESTEASTNPLATKSKKEVQAYAEDALNAAQAATKKIVLEKDIESAKKIFEEAKSEAKKANNAYNTCLGAYGDSKSIFAVGDADAFQTIAQKADQAVVDVEKAYLVLVNQEKANQFAALKKVVTEKAKQLQAGCQSAPLLQDVKLFMSNVQKATIEETNLSEIQPDRAQIASYTQIRLIGKAAPKKPAGTQFTSLADEIVAMIKQGQYQQALERLKNYPSCINDSTTDEYEATPLISAIVFLGLSKNGDPKNSGDKQLRQFILQMLKLPGIELTRTDSKDNTALHRAAWYGEPKLCEEMIELAQKTKQLNELKTKRNNNMVGATQQSESILDNIRHQGNVYLSSEEKIKLQRLMGVVSSLNVFSVPTLQQECKKDPTFLNHHDDKYWNTPLMQLLRLIRDSKNLNEKQELRQHMHQLLDQYWQHIDFTESNFNGDTVLHSAIWYGEQEIAAKIIEYSSQKSTQHLNAVLASRNTQGQESTKGADGVVVLSGGEVPHMNLAQKGKEAFLQFKQLSDSVSELIVTFLMNDPGLCVKGDTFDVLLDKIIQRLTMELSLCTEQKEKELLGTELLLLSEVLWAYQQLNSWQTLSNVTQNLLSPTQKTELNGLSQTHGKELEGYSSMNFLQSSPLVQLNKLIEACDADKVKSSMAAQFLKKTLLDLREHGSLELVESALESVSIQLANMSKPAGGVIGASSSLSNQQLATLFSDARNCLVRYKNHMTGETATLNKLIKSVTSASQVQIPAIVILSEPNIEHAVSAFEF